ncbi:MAG: DUF5343 domain-containing protein [Phenylobacterium sp.]
MVDTYPYVLNNGKIGKLLEAIGNAAKPSRFSYEFLKNIGFGSSNDRAFVSLFRYLGLVNENGAPTTAYDEVRDPGRRPFALGQLIKQAYADLFAINTSIHKASDADIRSAISRVTGKDAAYVGRAFSTFKALLSIAKFDGARVAERAVEIPVASEETPPEKAEATNDERPPRRTPSLNYNIEIHLPATTDISVYNAIFRSLRDTLGIH